MSMILTEKLSDPYGQRLDDQGRNTIMHLWKQNTSNQMKKIITLLVDSSIELKRDDQRKFMMQCPSKRKINAGTPLHDVFPFNIQVYCKGIFQNFIFLAYFASSQCLKLIQSINDFQQSYKLQKQLTIIICDYSFTHQLKAFLINRSIVIVQVHSSTITQLILEMGWKHSLIQIDIHKYNY